jgi:signal transduction histidine kinase
MTIGPGKDGLPVIDRRKAPATPEDSSQEIAKLNEEIDSLEESIGSLVHDANNFIVWVSPGLRMLRDDQEHGSAIWDTMVNLYEQGHETVSMLQQTFALAKSKIETDAETNSELLLELLRNRYEILQHITNITLPLITGRLQELSVLLQLLPREELKDNPDAPMLDSVIQATEQTAEFLEEKNAEIKEHRAEQLLFIDIGQFVSKLKPLLDAVRIESGVKVQVILPEEKIEGLIDSLMLSDIIVNLVVNAKDASADASPENKVVVVSVAVYNDPSSGEPFILLKVADKGTGMDDDTKKRIFEPSRFTTKGENGSGFGLVKIKKFVNENKGRMEVQSALGEGSTFSVYLPLRRRSEDL